MPDQHIRVEIVTPERRVLERDVTEVILPGVEGSFGVLPGHAPLLAGLAPGVALCRTEHGAEVMAISSGFAEVLPDRVIVLAETCETGHEIDAERAEKTVKELEALLAMGGPQIDLDVTMFRLRKHLARIEARKLVGREN